MRRIQQSTKSGIFAAASIGFAAWGLPATAAVCHVPAAVLCEGCVANLSIRVTSGGACRISFTAPASPTSSETRKFVDINVEAASPRPARRRAGDPGLSAARPAPRPSGAGCFNFNGRHFCE
jgi:hypothetical protein